MERQGRREGTRLLLLLHYAKETSTDDIFPSFQTGYRTLTMTKVTSLPLLLHRRSIGTWVLSRSINWLSLLAYTNAVLFC